MSFIDMFEHEYVCTFAGVRLYRVLSTPEFDVLREGQFILGGGDGEFPALAVDDYKACVAAWRNDGFNAAALRPLDWSQSDQETVHSWIDSWTSRTVAVRFPDRVQRVGALLGELFCFLDDGTIAPDGFRLACVEILTPGLGKLVQADRVVWDAHHFVVTTSD